MAGPNKPRNLRYFGTDVRDEDNRAVTPEVSAEPHKIFDRWETRPLLAAAALLGLGWLAATHDPLEAFKTSSKKQRQEPDVDEGVEEMEHQIYEDDEDDEELRELDEDIALIRGESAQRIRDRRNGSERWYESGRESDGIRGVKSGWRGKPEPLGNGALSNGELPVMPGRYRPEEHEDFDDPRTGEIDFEEDDENADDPVLGYSIIG